MFITGTCIGLFGVLLGLHGEPCVTMTQKFIPTLSKALNPKASGHKSRAHTSLLVILSKCARNLSRIRSPGNLNLLTKMTKPEYLPYIPTMATYFVSFSTATKSKTFKFPGFMFPKAPNQINSKQRSIQLPEL